MNLTETIKNLASKSGFDACGVTTFEVPSEAEQVLTEWVAEGKSADMRFMNDFQMRKNKWMKDFPDAKSVIVLGVNYFSMEKEKSETESGVRGRIARYAWGKDYHRVIADKTTSFIKDVKMVSPPEARFEISVDTKPLLERTYANQAGLGFLGKQTQLLSLEFGPWLFLAEIITNLVLQSDVPIEANCGTCRICIDSCPTAAIDATGTVDARKCIAYLTIEHKGPIEESLRPNIGDWVFGCDECLNVCPFTAKQKQTQWRKLTAQEGFGPQLLLKELLQVPSNRQYRSRFEGTALLRATRKQLLRNACIVLGNVGSLTDIPILREVMAHESELVSEHAKWAIDRISSRIQ